MKEQLMCKKCGKCNWSKYFNTCECREPNFITEKEWKLYEADQAKKKKTIDDLVKLSKYEPVISGYLVLAATGEMKREEALIQMVLALVDAKKDIEAKYIDHLMRCPMNQQLIHE